MLERDFYFILLEHPEDFFKSIELVLGIGVIGRVLDVGEMGGNPLQDQLRKFPSLSGKGKDILLRDSLAVSSGLDLQVKICLLIF